MYLTGLVKTVVIYSYTKYTCSYYGTHLLFCMCYPKPVSFIEFLMDFCIYDDILDAIQITDKKSLNFNSKSGQILHVDKSGFPRLGHIYTHVALIIDVRDVYNYIKSYNKIYYFWSQIIHVAKNKR